MADSNVPALDGSAKNVDDEVDNMGDDAACRNLFIMPGLDSLGTNEPLGGADIIECVHWPCPV